MKRTDAGPEQPDSRLPRCTRYGCSYRHECSHVKCPLRKPLTADFTPKSAYTQPCCDNERRNMNGGCDNCGDPCL